MLTGFRLIFPENRWAISNDNTGSRKLFIQFDNGTQTITNDLEAPDPLAGVGSTITVNALMTSIFEDYNKINASYITLVDTTDSDFAGLGTDRTITISFGGASGAQSGQAQLEQNSDGDLTGCTMEFKEDVLDSARDFVRVMTHEIGHCLGLDHPQESINSVMSYFSDENVVRLQIDDIMGIIYLYPKNSAAVEEDSTYGLGCSKR